MTGVICHGRIWFEQWSQKILFNSLISFIQPRCAGCGSSGILITLRRAADSDEWSVWFLHFSIFIIFFLHLSEQRRKQGRNEMQVWLKSSWIQSTWRRKHGLINLTWTWHRTKQVRDITPGSHLDKEKEHIYTRHSGQVNTTLSACSKPTGCMTLSVSKGHVSLSVPVVMFYLCWG